MKSDIIAKTEDKSRNLNKQYQQKVIAISKINVVLQIPVERTICRQLVNICKDSQDSQNKHKLALTAEYDINGKHSIRETKTVVVLNLGNKYISVVLMSSFLFLTKLKS